MGPARRPVPSAGPDPEFAPGRDQPSQRGLHFNVASTPTTDRVTDQGTTRDPDHDPDHDDTFLAGIEAEAQRLFSNAFMAREGLEVAL